MDIFVGVYQHAPSFLVVKGVSLEVLQSGEVLGEHTPLATCLDYVKYRVHYPAERMFPLPFLHIYDFFYNLPLIISEVGKQLLNLE